MSVVILLAPSAALASTINPDITVEAEYGSTVIEGSLYTAAHHQPAYSPYAGRHTVSDGRPSPCNDPSIPVILEGTILVSHVDLDTFGGCIRAMYNQPHPMFTDFQSLWDLAEFVDTNGAHKLGVSGASALDLRRLHAFWAWAKTNPRFPRDVVTDITKLVEEAFATLSGIFGEDEKLLVAGDKFKAQGDDLNRASFIQREGHVIERLSDQFVNHLYAPVFGPAAKAVVAQNSKTRAITLSLADPVEGVSCRTIAQRLWGPEAGGHEGIAGSPREREMEEEDVRDAVRAMNAELFGE